MKILEDLYFGKISRRNVLTNKVQLLKQSVTQTAGGEFTKTFTDLGFIFAGIFPAMGKVETNLSKNQLEITHKIIINYNSDFDDSCKMVLDDKTYFVNGFIDFQQKNKFLLVDAFQEVSSGR